MDFFETIAKRRSVRKFTDEAIPEEIIRKVLRTSVLAANSSNLQPWQFYWVRNKQKKEELKRACFSQSAASTAQELIVAVSNINTWKRNRDFIIKDFEKRGTVPRQVNDYYNKLVPFAYYHDPIGVSSTFKKILFLFISLIGYFRPVPRGPVTRQELFEVVTKTTALACQNIMMGLVAEGFDSCPMEGFDEKRVKKLLNLGINSHVVMVIGAGKGNSEGVYGDRSRIDENLVIKEVT
jgi:nitroreductase